MCWQAKEESALLRAELRRAKKTKLDVDRCLYTTFFYLFVYQYLLEIFQSENLILYSQSDCLDVRIQFFLLA